MLQTEIGRLRLIAMIEGVSFLVLLGVAMPLKYVAGMPIAVKVAGWTHGVLFILFCMALWAAADRHAWPRKQWATVFVAALLPFGPFVVDGRLKREDAVESAS